MKDTSVYVKASLFDIQSILEPLIGQHLIQSETKHSTKITFSKPNNEYVMREILHLKKNPSSIVFISKFLETGIWL